VRYHALHVLQLMCRCTRIEVWTYTPQTAEGPRLQILQTRRLHSFTVTACAPALVQARIARCVDTQCRASAGADFVVRMHTLRCAHAEGPTDGFDLIVTAIQRHSKAAYEQAKARAHVLIAEGVQVQPITLVLLRALQVRSVLCAPLQLTSGRPRTPHPADWKSALCTC
jgi:hypothetical protein